MSDYQESMPSRSRRRRRWFEYKTQIPVSWSIVLGITIWAIFFGLWQTANLRGWAPAIILPAPPAVISALYELIIDKGFLYDIWASVWRVVLGFAAACAVSAPLGILMGSFKTVEGFFNPLVSAWRYIPAAALIPLLLMWLGTGELVKISILFLGAVWFLITLIMDHTKAVRAELIETALTLGATRKQVLMTVVLPAVSPDIVTSARQMLAASWTYLVIAEITAQTTGIGAMMMRSRRFIHVDEIMAGILVIGLLGLMFDLLFRLVHRLMFSYLEESE